MSKPKLLVVGNGMVGQRFLELAVSHKLLDVYDIEVFGEEPRPAYDRVRLSEYFNGKTAADLSLCSNGFFQKNGIKLLLNTKVCRLCVSRRELILDNDRVITYDKLVLATGAFPFVPPIPGKDKTGCFVYRTIDDLDEITKAAQHARRGVVIGGGLLGLEAANAIKNLGLETHVVEFAPRLMNVQLDLIGGETLQSKIEALGVVVHTSKVTDEIVTNDDGLLQLNFSDNECLTTDLIVFSAGIRPRDELAKDSGLILGERGGVLIDDYCQTSEAGVYAVGECAIWNKQHFGLVAPGYQMAEVVAKRLAIESFDVDLSISTNTNESDIKFTGADMSTKLKLLGVDVASIGDAHGKTPGAVSYSLKDDADLIYKRLWISPDDKKLVGAVLVGDTEDYGYLQQLCINGIELEDAPTNLLMTDTGEQSNVSAIDKLPDNAQVCSCHNVTKNKICSAVANGATNLEMLKSKTKAATGCGGCTQLVSQILNYELETQGVQIDKSLCEHFSFTRQELYHLVRVEQIKTYEEILKFHGRGIGCDICKPTIASILASCWNDYILDDAHIGLQDTNDRFLANMQRNGTYSVVPRIPGGEITPDKLIVIGQVAKKYDLYTKVTGGQRIDLFGATSEQLPLIWAELISAGFETGHAYGKSVRTVKSCVGSTWCRYGVQDSVGKAIDIENRYKGLRAPHKLKFAVSGCTRECAEAQSKDVGIIATEQGWNLYVGGNGGMRPRHADLLATELNDSQLQQYIDRFLMFYIRTADRLQRTSVWLENLDGGVEYLRQVICEDSLNIAEQLEAEISDIVSAYQCEWQTTLNDSNKVKQFQPFINTELTDTSIEFVRERGQRRPLGRV